MFDLSPLYSWLPRLIPADFLAFPWMQRAMVALILLAPMAAAMGVQVVNFRQAFFADAVSHTAFAGAALGLLCGVEPRLSMIIFAVAVGLGIAAVQRRGELSADTATGVLFSAAVAFGLAVVYRRPDIGKDVGRFLYGDLLTLQDADLVCLAGLFVLVIAAQFSSYNRLLYLGLDSALARAHGLAASFHQYGFAVLLALVAIVAVWAVGVLLVAALLVVPAAAARCLARSTRGMFWWAIAISVFSAISGLAISDQDWAGTPPGATVILVAAICFAVAWGVRALKVHIGKG